MSKVCQLSVVETEALLIEKNNPLILDKRDMTSYKQGHIDGAMMADDGLIESVINTATSRTPFDVVLPYSDTKTISGA